MKHRIQLGEVRRVHLLTATSAVGIIAARLRSARRAQVPAGHHADFAITALGITVIETSNDALAEELLARNPSARRAREPLPNARVVERD